MFFKSKINDEKKVADEPSSFNANTNVIDTFNVLKNKNKWILLRENEERPIFSSSSKIEAINKAEHFSQNKEYKINIFNVKNELINTRIMIKN